ncbi:MAG: RNA polymerase sigma factor [Coraliomargarita sp.]|nr:RNA polymerase sigma factor [Coraliomargarita sp.]
MSADFEQLLMQWLQDYEALIYKVIHGFAETEQDRRELFAEITFQLWTSLQNYSGKCAESTWIYRVSLNSAMKWKRSEAKLRKQWASLEKLPLSEQYAAEPRDQAQLKMLYDAIRRLPELGASLVIMHLDGLSYKKMAEISGISESNVGVTLNRARKKLFELMKGDKYV